MKSDVEIAQQATMKPITQVGAELGIDEEELDLYGKYKAKLDLAIWERLKSRPDGKLVLVSAINPTPAGEAFPGVEVHANQVPPTSGGQRGIVASLRTIDDVVAYEAELQRRATFDDLTGALKREEAMRLLTNMASYWRDPGRDSAVLFCDLDAFKQVNDTYGHVAGDQVLRTVVDRIRGAVRASDVVARMGGDEFVVVLDGIHGMSEALQIAEGIRLTVCTPIGVANATVTSTLSIGVILRKPGEDADVLISRADTAMYAAKSAGRNQVVAVE